MILRAIFIRLLRAERRVLLVERKRVTSLTKETTSNELRKQKKEKKKRIELQKREKRKKKMKERRRCHMKVDRRPQKTTSSKE